VRQTANHAVNRCQVIVRVRARTNQTNAAQASWANRTGRPGGAIPAPITNSTVAAAHQLARARAGRSPTRASSMTFPLGRNAAPDLGVVALEGGDVPSARRGENSRCS
jgi:hypothetical protein